MSTDNRTFTALGRTYETTGWIAYDLGGQDLIRGRGATERDAIGEAYLAYQMKLVEEGEDVATGDDAASHFKGRLLTIRATADRLAESDPALGFRQLLRVTESYRPEFGNPVDCWAIAISAKERAEIFASWSKP